MSAAAFRAAMTICATADGSRPLADFVREAFESLAAGLIEPTPTEETEADR